MKRKIKNALISVSEKEGLFSILKVLRRFKIKIISSGGTFRSTKKLGLSAKRYQNLQILKRC